ncbi:hypothetical protein PPL_00615 [Heterostelium album PN500]|uniref:Uncharacterized protein n=1 Tax=Heterostelium pallidum (strain ATCC 26659 / Pp 5 / PN500) TaxID=670386 RepID=D3AWY7_HETP5|nr:hypothetical protein PPL_00615 [Heterostelium album PN500]EFA86810.1 hypothetical protein PPL_00615 [Heterostelium album PN500]|eukprot:XP_020438913.1 hypothetical protein PPL_00615 [Heterostelium album PN500]
MPTILIGESSCLGGDGFISVNNPRSDHVYKLFTDFESLYEFSTEANIINQCVQGTNGVVKLSSFYGGDIYTINGTVYNTNNPSLPPGFYLINVTMGSGTCNTTLGNEVTVEKSIISSSISSSSCETIHISTSAPLSNNFNPPRKFCIENLMKVSFLIKIETNLETSNSKRCPSSLEIPCHSCSPGLIEIHDLSEREIIDLIKLGDSDWIYN